MDPMTASYYRAILFRDSQDQRPIPPTLVLLHAWAFKRFQAMGAGSIISKQAALCVATTWMSSTNEGRAYANEFTEIGELFSSEHHAITDDLSFVPPDANVVDWDSLPAKSHVIVTVNQKSISGEYIGRRGGWIDVLVGGDKKQYRANQVQLFGA